MQRGTESQKELADLRKELSEIKGKHEKELESQ